jgi:dienelactone hydrolase
VHSRFGRMLAAALVAVVVAAACSDDGGEDATAATTSLVAPTTTTTTPLDGAPHDVGVTTETFVDTTRPTPKSGDVAARPERTIETVIYYPATDGERPDRDAGPYPLVVFSHGLGATPQLYEDVLVRWAAAGYVVAAPVFPLSNAQAPAGPDGGDVVNQPGDVSFVIDEVIEAAAGEGALAGMVDGDHVGVAGHSNGAITTLGLVGGPCCRDERVDAAIAIAGTGGGFPGGIGEIADGPPLLLVHGTEDPLIPYEGAVDAFNEARGPKGLLTIVEGDHGSYLGDGGPGFDEMMGATSDFFAVFLRGDAAALARLPGDGGGVTTMRFEAEEGSTATIVTQPPPPTDRQASVSADTALVNGQRVTVRWSGFLGDVVNIVQCSSAEGGSAACDLVRGRILQPNPDGEGSLELEIVVGAVGNGVCDATHPCVIVVNDGSSQNPDATIRLPITFAA